MTPLHLVSSMATKALLEALARDWQAQGGTPVRVESVGGVDALQRVSEGEAFDVVVLAADAIERLVASGRAVPGTRVDLAKSEVAIAVREGAAQPSIESAESLRAALPQAGRIAYSTGPSGVALQRLLERWGLLDALGDRLVQAPPGVPVAALLARGDAELGFQQRSELAGMPGIEIVGPMPRGIEIVTTFSAARCSTSARSGEVGALLDHLGRAAAGAASLHGMTPASLNAGSPSSASTPGRSLS
jgi:molybdate transport system substrate-binding protein